MTYELKNKTKKQKKLEKMIHYQSTVTKTYNFLLHLEGEQIKRATERKTRAPHAVPKLVCRGPSFYLKIKLKKGHNSKSTAFRVMPCVPQLHLVMISKHSKFGVDTLSTF